MFSVIFHGNVSIFINEHVLQNVAPLAVRIRLHLRHVAALFTIFDVYAVFQRIISTIKGHRFNIMLVHDQLLYIMSDSNAFMNFRLHCLPLLPIHLAKQARHRERNFFCSFCMRQKKV